MAMIILVLIIIPMETDEFVDSVSSSLIIGYSILLVMNIIIGVAVIAIFYFANKNAKLQEPEIQKVYQQISDSLSHQNKFKRILVILMSITIFFLSINVGLYFLAAVEIISELLNILIYDSVRYDASENT